ncbi:MAG: hypothetical protein IKE66_01430 [Hyphomicrobium sp.]|nr:hypothetical protein [Hyphomicrobium sp.]
MSRRKYAQAANLKAALKRPDDVRIHLAPNGRADNRMAINGAPDWRTPGAELLAVFRRHQGWIAILVAGALAAACLSLLLRQPAYTSTAIFQRVFTVESTDRNDRPLQLDAAALVKSQMFRLQSTEFSRRTIDRMIRERVPGQRLSALYPSIFGSLKDDASPTPVELDVANRKFLKRLSVWNEARTYVIIVAYTGVTPDEAARVVNFVVAEHERANKIQEAAAQQSAAQNAIQKLAMTLGPKHPQMVQAVADLTAARTRLDAEENAPLIQESELLATGEVIPARPVTISSSIGKTNVLIYALFMSLLIALIAVVLLEYRSIEAIFSRHVKAPAKPENETAHIRQAL